MFGVDLTVADAYRDLKKGTVAISLPSLENSVTNLDPTGVAGIDRVDSALVAAAMSQVLMWPSDATENRI